MKRLTVCLAIAAACCAAPAADIAPPPREVSDVQRLRLDEQFAERGQVDLFIASTAALNWRPEDERLWVPATKLGQKAVTLAEMKYEEDRKPRAGPLWFDDFRMYRAKTNPELVRSDTVYTRTETNTKSQRRLVVQAPGVNVEAVLCGFVVSRGPVKTKAHILESLILATGDVTASGGVSSVIICDGDVHLGAGARQCLIIARGKIEMKSADTSVLTACGVANPGKVPDINIPPLRNPNDPFEVHVWKTQAAMAERRMVIVRDKQTNPLGFITFFELTTIGLEVNAANGSLQVAKLTAGGACAKAGVKVGDVILDVGGKKPKDAESLRRLLRDSLAIGDATMKLQRGTETLSIKVSLPE